MKKLLLLAAVGVVCALATPAAAQYESDPNGNLPPVGPEAHLYANCDAVRAAGVDPLSRGTEGYRPALDGDGDGIACEVVIQSSANGHGYVAQSAQRARLADTGPSAWVHPLTLAALGLSVVGLLLLGVRKYRWGRA